MTCLTARRCVAGEGRGPAPPPPPPPQIQCAAPPPLPPLCTHPTTPTYPLHPPFPPQPAAAQPQTGLLSKALNSTSRVMQRGLSLSNLLDVGIDPALFAPVPSALTPIAEVGTPAERSELMERAAAAAGGAGGPGERAGGHGGGGAERDPELESQGGASSKPQGKQNKKTPPNWKVGGWMGGWSASGAHTAGLTGAGRAAVGGGYVLVAGLCGGGGSEEGWWALGRVARADTRAVAGPADCHLTSPPCPPLHGSRASTR